MYMDPDNYNKYKDHLVHLLLTAVLNHSALYFQFYRDLTLVTRDGLTKIMTLTNQIIYEKWIKLVDTPRTQVN
jgi:hypothetical protein